MLPLSMVGIIQRVRRLLHPAAAGGTASYGVFWQDKGDEFYETLYGWVPKIHDCFREWYAARSDIASILEVGCGTSLYGRTFFQGWSYHGTDISESAIEIARSRDTDERHSYSAADFIADESYGDRRFNLVFSQPVVDHVYDIDKFIEKCVALSDRYVWIAAYLGYNPRLKSHKMIWKPKLTCYMNKLSVPQVRSLLDRLGVRYWIDALPFEDRGKRSTATIIRVEKAPPAPSAPRR